MLNFYQSDLWKTIQREIYKNPTFDLEIFGKKYQGIIKKKKIGPMSLDWYQVLGVEFPSDEDSINRELLYIKKKFTKFGASFFQIGSINEIVRFENCVKPNDEFKKEVKDIRLGIQHSFRVNHKLRTSFRDNMPLAGMIYDVRKSDDELLAEMNESCRKRVKKSREAGLVFKVLTIDQYQEFYDKWLATAGAKGFNIISPKQFWALTGFLEEKNLGNLVAVVKDGEIVAGSICLYPSKDYMVCMYGFADRNFGKLGLNHFLKFETFRWARSFGFSFVDTMGGAPTGFVDHELASVSEFKESLGGEKIEYYGNYDLVLNPLIYKFFKVYFGLRH